MFNYKSLLKIYRSETIYQKPIAWWQLKTLELFIFCGKWIGLFEDFLLKGNCGKFSLRKDRDENEKSVAKFILALLELKPQLWGDSSWFYCPWKSPSIYNKINNFRENLWYAKIKNNVKKELKMIEGSWEKSCLIKRKEIGKMKSF